MALLGSEEYMENIREIKQRVIEEKEKWKKIGNIFKVNKLFLYTIYSKSLNNLIKNKII